MVLLVALIAAAPWVLFFDPIARFHRAHIPRDEPKPPWLPPNEPWPPRDLPHWSESDVDVSG